jgi:hypothetical protein
MRGISFTASALLVLSVSVHAQSHQWQWPIRVSENHRYLVDSTGKPFFALGDSLWKTHLYSPDEVELIFEDRSQKGFTVLCVATGCEGDLKNYRGEEAFIGDDLSRPNEAYWQHIDFIIQAALDRNMAVMFNPIWIRHHRKRVDASGPNGCRGYGEWLATRFQRFENVMYFIGGDHPPRDEKDELEAMARAIESAAPDALITYHAEHQHPSKDCFPDATWLDINWTYAYTPEHRKPNYPYNQGFEEWQDHPETPVWFGEGYYDWGGIGLKGNDVGRYMMRRQMYWVLLSSVAGYDYGAEGLQDKQNNYYGNGLTWQDTLDYFSSYDCRLMLEFINGFEWWTLVPDHGNQTLIGGHGHYMGTEGDDYALAARTRGGGMIVAYTPVTHDLEIDLSRLSGPAKARWFNPVTGLYSEIGSVPNEGTRRFRSPGDNGTGREDWVLVIEAEN